MTSTYDQLINEGLARGKADMLLKQLAKRSGELPTAITDRIRAADVSQLEQWALRPLDAETLEQVFTED